MMEQEAPSVLLSYVEKPKDSLKSLICAFKRFKKMCVFCGSSNGKKGVLSHEALNLGPE